ncbi:MAG: hypothetical protein LBO74_00970 [Candidatus Symbiothrix sp.]|jgi:hypothetical protein|nr:hypothetical protein [Candidatus Symbiothrix sp.]
MKKLTQFLVAFMLLLGGTQSVSAYDYAVGAGTDTSPYEVATAADLAGIKDNLTAVYKLTADIDLTDVTWTPIAPSAAYGSAYPIPAANTTFTGKVYGEGHKISNITYSARVGAVGLFGILGPGASIDNLHIASGAFTSSTQSGTTYSRVGSIAARIYIPADATAGVSITNCSNAATVTSAVAMGNSGNATGGLVGEIGILSTTQAVNISNCVNTGNVSGALHSGGLVGRIGQNSTTAIAATVNITNSYSNATLSRNDVVNIGTYIGGIVGINYAKLTINNCFAAGAIENITSKTDRNYTNITGGIVGSIGVNGTVTNSVALQTAISAQRPGNYGGNPDQTAFRIRGSSTGTLTNNYASDAIVITDSVGTVVPVTSTDAASPQGADVTLADAQTAAFYTGLGWDFTNIWEITAGGFPTLKPVTASGPVPTTYTVTFTVKDASATAITDAVVTFNSVANAAGNYVFADIAAGEYAYSVTKAGYVTATGNVTVSDANVTKDITLELEPVVGGPILIATRAALAAIATDLTAEYKLTADIDLAGEDWTPLGTFTGTLDGNGYAIKNISINSSAANVGLFSELGNGATITGVNIVGGSITATAAVTKVGGIAGNISGTNVTITNSGNSANITATATTGTSGTTAPHVGGIVGSIAGSLTITSSFNKGTISGGLYTGGIIGGSVSTATGLSISNCYSQAAISSNYASAYVAQIAGYAYQGGPYVIENCYATGTVNSKYATGLVGRIKNAASSNIRNNVALMDDITGDASHAHPTLGYDANTIAYSNNYYNSAMTGISGTVVLAARQNGTATTTLDDAKTAAWYATNLSAWDFTNIWSIEEGSLPILKWEVTTTPPAPTTYTVTFTVKDESAADITDAVVTFGGTTKAVGEYVFTDVAAGTEIAYSVSKDGYITQSGTLDVVDGNVTKDIILIATPATTYTVTFTVADAGATAITDAVVTFNEVANAAGNYVFTEIAAGTYAYSVAKTGYDTATGSVTVTDANVTEPVILTETPAPTSSIKYVVPNGTGDGSSWENALGSIKDAYDLVSAPDDEVRVKIGSYPFEAITLKSGVHLKGGYTGVGDTRVSDPSQTVWNGSATATTPFLTNTAGLSASTEVSGLTFTGTKSTTQAVLRVALTGTTSIDLKFLNNIFQANESVEGTLVIGGAAGNTGRVSFENCVVSKNTATKTSLCNGGIYLGSGTAINVSVINSTIVGNSVPNYAGGSGTAGLSMRSGTTNKVSNTLFYGNTTSAGIGNYYKGGSATVALTNNVNAGATNVTIDFVDYANNDYRLAATATNAIDAGSDVAGEFTATDILGNAITGTKRDIGAYEWQGGGVVTYTVTFTVKDASEVAITDAVVTFNEVANAAGDYVFANIAAGAYAYSVAKTGYVTATGSVTVTDADVTTDITLQLTPVTGDPILIATKTDLIAIATDLTAEYKLTADIDLAGDDWTPIGTSDDPFTGKLYGDGHSIQNISITSGNYVGLFGALASGAIIDDVHIDGGSITGTDYVGGITAYVKGSVAGGAGVIIRNSSNSATITATGSASHTGGLVGGVGLTTAGSVFTLSTSYNTGNVQAGGLYAGGLVGWINGNGTATITDCYNSSTVATSSTGSSYIGAIVGYMYQVNSTADCKYTVTNCYATGVLTTTNASGLIGRIANAATTHVENNAALMESISGTASYANAILGYNAANAVLTNNQVSSSMLVRGTVISAEDSRQGGIRIPLENAKTAAFYAATLPTWDFTNIWTIDEGVSYPYFKYQGAPIATYTVTFTVKDESATAITDAVVTFNNKANAAGNYEFANIAAGAYAYSVVKEGYEAATGNVTVTDANVVVDVTLQLIPVIPTYSVTFVITDASGAAITDAVVTFDNVEYPEGNYIVADLVAGTYTYMVEKEGYEAATGNVTVTDANVTVPVTLATVVGIGSVNANDAIVSTKYYNLQGIEVAPKAKGIYIVRNTHASGKVTSSKELVVKLK